MLRRRPVSRLHGWLSERLDTWADGTDASHILFQAGMLETEIDEAITSLRRMFTVALRLRKAQPPTTTAVA